MQPEPTPTELMSAIVDLHAAVSAGFERVDGRFGGLESRIAGVETSVTSIKGEVSGLQRWMAASDERFAALERHVARG